VFLEQGNAPHTENKKSGDILCINNTLTASLLRIRTLLVGRIQSEECNKCVDRIVVKTNRQETWAQTTRACDECAESQMKIL